MDLEQAERLEKYLHENIPISAHMQVSVRFSSTDLVVLSAPLGPNVNHQRTVFGGSASAVATLAAWSLLHLRLTAAGHRGDLVIQSNEMHYDRPMPGPFEAKASLADPAAWPAFLKLLARRKRGRIDARSDLIHDGAVAGRFEGRFVTLLA